MESRQRYGTGITRLSNQLPGVVLHNCKGMFVPADGRCTVLFALERARALERFHSDCSVDSGKRPEVVSEF
eukprot:3941659-Rhodomonas_salina.2